MSHTKGRLRFDCDPHQEIGHSDVSRYRLWSDKRPIIDGYVIVKEDAARIVALWNTAEELGLTTEAIEAGAIQGAFNALRSVRDESLFTDDDGSIGVTSDLHMHDELFERVCAPLRSLTKDVQS